MRSSSFQTGEAKLRLSKPILISSQMYLAPRSLSLLAILFGLVVCDGLERFFHPLKMSFTERLL